MSLKTPINYEVKHYTNTDTDAPQITNTDGSAKTILKACLVTGYGDKPSAGWTMPFEDTNSIVLRSKKRTGQPPDLRFDNGSTNRGSLHKVTSFDFESMTSIDHTNNELANTGFNVRHYSINPEWHLYATDFSFMFMMSASSDRCNAYYFGEAMKLRDSDQNIFVGTNMSIKTSGFMNKEPSAQSSMLKDMKSNAAHSQEYMYINNANNEKLINNEYFLQQVFCMSRFAKMPYFASIAGGKTPILPEQINAGGRDFMLHPIFKPYEYTSVFVPLDFWAL